MVEEAKDTKPLTQAEIYAKGRTGYSPSLSPKDVSVLESKYQKQSDILYQRRFGLVANTVKREVESTLNNAKNDYQQNIQQYQNEIKKYQDYIEKERLRYIEKIREKPKNRERYKERYDEVKDRYKDEIYKINLKIRGEKDALSYLNSQINDFNRIKNNPEQLLKTYDKNVARNIVSNADKVATYRVQEKQILSNINKKLTEAGLRPAKSLSDYNKMFGTGMITTDGKFYPTTNKNFIPIKPDGTPYSSSEYSFIESSHIQQAKDIATGVYKEPTYIPGSSSPVGGGEIIKEHIPTITLPKEIIPLNIQEQQRILNEIKKLQREGPNLQTSLIFTREGIKEQIIDANRIKIERLRKELEQKRKIEEKFDSNLGMFVRTDTELGTTVIARPPTVEEIKESNLVKLTKEEKIVEEITKLYKEGPQYKTILLPVYGTSMIDDVNGYRKQTVDVNKYKIYQLEQKLNDIRGYSQTPIIKALYNTVLYKTTFNEIQNVYFNSKDRIQKSDKTFFEYLYIISDEFMKSSFFKLNYIFPILKVSEGRLLSSPNPKIKEDFRKLKETYKEEYNKIKVQNEYIKLTSKQLPFTTELNTAFKIKSSIEKELEPVIDNLNIIIEKINSYDNEQDIPKNLIDSYNNYINKYYNLESQYKNIGQKVQNIYDKIGYSYTVDEYNIPQVDDELFKKLSNEVETLEDKLIKRGANPIEVFAFVTLDPIMKELASLALFFATMFVGGSIIKNLAITPKKMLTISQQLQKMKHLVIKRQIATAVVSIMTPIYVTSSATMSYLSEYARSGNEKFAIISGVASGVITSAIMFPSVYRAYKSLNETIIARNYLEAYKRASELNIKMQQQLIRSQMESKNFQAKKAFFTRAEITNAYKKLPQNVVNVLPSQTDVKGFNVQIESTQIKLAPYTVVQDVTDKTQFYIMQADAVNKYFNIYAFNVITNSGAKSIIAFTGVENIPAVTKMGTLESGLEHLFKYASQKNVFRIDTVGGGKFYIVTKEKIVTLQNGQQIIKLGKDPLQLAQIQSVDSKKSNKRLIAVSKIQLPYQLRTEDMSTAEKTKELWSKLEFVGLKPTYRISVQNIVKPTPATFNMLSRMHLEWLVNPKGDIIITASELRVASLLGNQIYNTGYVIDKNQKVIVDMNKAYRDFVRMFGRQLGDSGILSGGGLFGTGGTGGIGGGEPTPQKMKGEVWGIISQAIEKGYVEMSVGEIQELSESTQSFIVNNAILKDVIMRTSTTPLTDIKPIKLPSEMIQTFAPSKIEATKILAKTGQQIVSPRFTVESPEQIQLPQQTLLTIQPQIIELQNLLNNPLTTFTQIRIETVQSKIITLEKILKSYQPLLQIQKYKSLMTQKILQQQRLEILRLQQRVLEQTQLKILTQQIRVLTQQRILTLTQQMKMLQTKIINLHKTLQKQLIDLKQLAQTKFIDGTITPPPGIFPPLLFPTRRPQDEKKKIEKKKEKPKYESYIKEVRKSGKWVTIPGRYATYGEALAAGVEKVSTTLRASFRIKKVNEKANKKISQLNVISSMDSLRERFYQSPKEKGVWIERRPYRLSSKTEVKEIQEAKKKAEEDRRFWFG